MNAPSQPARLNNALRTTSIFSFVIPWVLSEHPGALQRVLVFERDGRRDGEWDGSLDHLADEHRSMTAVQTARWWSRTHL